MRLGHEIVEIHLHNLILIKTAHIFPPTALLHIYHLMNFHPLPWPLPWRLFPTTLLPYADWKLSVVENLDFFFGIYRQTDEWRPTRQTQSCANFIMRDFHFLFFLSYLILVHCTHNKLWKMFKNHFIVSHKYIDRGAIK